MKASTPSHPTYQAGLRSTRPGDRAEPGLGAKVADAALVRPLAVLGASLSTVAFFVAVVPAWVIGVDDRDLAHHMVKRPWHHVRSRELGDFGDSG
jgi:hypothetical protein